MYGIAPANFVKSKPTQPIVHTIKIYVLVCKIGLFKSSSDMPDWRALVIPTKRLSTSSGWKYPTRKKMINKTPIKIFARPEPFSKCRFSASNIAKLNPIKKPEPSPKIIRWLKVGSLGFIISAFYTKRRKPQFHARCPELSVVRKL